MHMADALISPAVGVTMGAVSAAMLGYSCKKVKRQLAEEKIPLMGIMGAFIFAAQMINFTIPATGSSGHLGGGLLLAILLGPYAGFVTIASVLIIQALFFADGGLLALGCNVFNLGFFSCFIAYPLIYKPIVNKYTTARIFTGSILAAVIGLQMGAFSVVLETLLSGKTQLPFDKFLMLMQPIHLAIGLVEGVVTAAVVQYIYNVKPEILTNNINNNGISMKKLVVIISIGTILIGGGLSLIASEMPDGLEWSIEKITAGQEIEVDSGIHTMLAAIQEKISFLPDYNLNDPRAGGTSIAGIVGAAISFVVLLFAGKMFKNI